MSLVLCVIVFVGTLEFIFCHMEGLIYLFFLFLSNKGLLGNLVRKIIDRKFVTLSCCKIHASMWKIVEVSLYRIPVEYVIKLT